MLGSRGQNTTTTATTRTVATESPIFRLRSTRPPLHNGPTLNGRPGTDHAPNHRDRSAGPVHSSGWLSRPPEQPVVEFYRADSPALEDVNHKVPFDRVFQPKVR